MKNVHRKEKEKKKNFFYSLSIQFNILYEKKCPACILQGVNNVKKTTHVRLLVLSFTPKIIRQFFLLSLFLLQREMEECSSESAQ